MNNRGFTLLELLIAITMLALITGIMSGALSMAHRSLGRGEKKIYYLEKIKASFSLVESQIQSLFPSQYVDQGEKKLLFSGQKDGLLFSTNYSIWRGTQGNTLVYYAVQTDDKGKQYIQATEQIMGLENKKQTILFEGCDKIYFEYYLKDAFEEGKWVDQWTEENKMMPEKIKINFVSGKKKTSLIVNVLVRTISSSSSSWNYNPIVTK